MRISLRVMKIGKNRLVIYLPNKFRKESGFKFGETLKLEITKEKRTAVSISKFNYLITLKKEIISLLNLKEGDIIEIKFNKTTELNKPSKIFSGGKVDLLYFIPEKTRKGSEPFVEEISKNSIQYLRICSFHNRGSGSQLEILRFVDGNMLGRFLGQMQAEGTKNFLDKIEFCNKSLSEHKEFLNFLEHLGIPKNKIFVKVDYHTKITNIQEEINKFERELGLSVNYISSSSTSGGGFGFKIIIRNTLLAEIILEMMNSFRKILAEEDWGENLSSFANGFLSKILDGDGSFEIISKNRKVPQARLTIADSNLEYLKDYQTIMGKFGFNPKINKKWGFVRSYCNPELAKKILEIGAFKNNSNKTKVEWFIENRFSNKEMWTLQTK